MLAQVDARLGEKELALKEARHAVDLMPVTRDAYDGFSFSKASRKFTPGRARKIRRSKFCRS